MSRAQGHIANVLWVLFDHVIESQRHKWQPKDTEMATGKHSSTTLTDDTATLRSTPGVSNPSEFSGQSIFEVQVMGLTAWMIATSVKILSK